MGTRTLAELGEDTSENRRNLARLAGTSRMKEGVEHGQVCSRLIMIIDRGGY